MRRSLRAHLRDPFRSLIAVAILRLALPLLLARHLAHPPADRLSARALVITVARISNEELFAMATLAPAFGVHGPHPSRPWPTRQTRSYRTHLGPRGKKIDRARR